MTRGRVAFTVSGVALGLVNTDLETGELAAEMAGFTCAEAATANVTLRTKVANIEFLIILPELFESSIFGERGAPRSQKPCSFRSKCRKGSTSQFGSKYY